MPADPFCSTSRIRFGDFEVDLRSHELSRLGRKIRLQEKSFLVLNVLLKRPGQVVTREELTAALWPEGYFVDTEHGLNTAVLRLREALGDSAEEPRFVETLPKLGYRFIGAIEETAGARAEVRANSEEKAISSSTTPSPDPNFAADSQIPFPEPPIQSELAQGASFRRRILAALVLGVALALVVIAIVAARARWSRASEVVGPAPRASGSNEAVEELLDRARYLRNHKRYDEARRLAEEAVKLVPDSGEALAGLALNNVVRDPDRARAMALRALELDSKAWEAHRALGALARSAGDQAGALRHFRLAVETNPADAKTRTRLARQLLNCGRLEEAHEQMVESRRLAPDNPDVQHIWIEYALATGDYEGAIRQGELWLAVWGAQLPTGNVDSVRALLAMARLGAGAPADSIPGLEADFPRQAFRSALSLAHAGNPEEARAALDARLAASKAAGAAADPALAEELGMLYVVLGEHDPAFEQIDRQLAAGSYPSWLNLPLFHGIRSDPRWLALQKRLETELCGGEPATTAVQTEDL